MLHKLFVTEAAGAQRRIIYFSDSACVLVDSSLHGLAMDLSTLLSPLVPEHLGVLAIGCLTSDSPGRASTVRALLQKHFGVDVAEDEVACVITRISRACPHLLAGYTQEESVLQPRTMAHVALWTKQFVPPHWDGVCILDNGALVRTATRPTTCFTLAFGMRAGEIALYQCCKCGATYAGPWCWPTGGADKKFPDGYHRPRGATNLQLLEGSRWFFATPQVCWETSFLQLCLLLAARGGVSWTALFTVYHSMFSQTFAGTQYAQRTHFIAALEMAAPWLLSCSYSLFAFHVYQQTEVNLMVCSSVIALESCVYLQL